jgi:hypothetical protein
MDSRSADQSIYEEISNGIKNKKNKPKADPFPPKMATQASVFEGEPQQDECPF